jgi:arylformamidase
MPDHERNPRLDYNNQAFVADFPKFFEQWKTESARIRDTRPCYLNVPYGNGPKQTLDIFLPSNRPATYRDLGPVFVSIHGGWWYFLSKEDQNFVAEAFLDEGCVVVCPEYLSAPMASIGELVASCRLALLWTYKNIQRFGGDRHRIHVGGQSAGAHLTTMCMATDWTALGGPADLVKSASSISGLYDLHDLLDSNHNDHIRMTPSDAEENSPLLHMPSTANPMIIAVGGQERPGFLRQHKLFAGTWTSPNRPVTDVSLPDDNHYHTLGRMSDRNGPLFPAMIEQVLKSPKL